MSFDVKIFVMHVLKFLGWYIFKDEYINKRKERIDKINYDYIAKIQNEMYKDE